MSKVNASIVYMLGSFIFLLSVIIPQFANAQEDIPKINEKQKQALELFSNSQSQHQQTSANDIPQNNLHSDKNILKKIIQQELQENLNEQEKQEQTIIDNQQQQQQQQQINPIKAKENSKPVKEQGQEQQQQQQVKQRIQQQAESNNNQMETLPEVIIFEHADFGGEQQSIKGSDPNIHSWNDKISSVIVKSGTWQFFEHENYGSPSSKQVGPGYYEYVEIPEFNIRNDNITAIKAISSSPQGDHLNSKPVKEQGQEQVTNNDKEIKALELFFNKGTQQQQQQQQEIQQQSNEVKQQQEVKSKTA
ncbi:MAG TPA: beta/gamma crystallin-related protein, partial [Nitrososphaeraceae archaeon]|nr:beta/gamma crystallin-related protein [Nitrososphaeraceae archaeon]